MFLSTHSDFHLDCHSQVFNPDLLLAFTLFRIVILKLRKLTLFSIQIVILKVRQICLSTRSVFNSDCNSQFETTHSIFNPDCHPQVKTEGGDSCRPRSEALESGKGEIYHNLVLLGLDWFSLEGIGKQQR